MQLSSILVLALVSAAHAVSFYSVVKEEWSLFKATHNKKYEPKNEDGFRMKVYMQNKHIIAKHNLKFKSGLVSYDLKMNHFGDLLTHEYAALVNGYRNSTNAPVRRGATFITPPDHITLPRSVDWREKGAVTPVKNQGQCGSCWAFSATGALEGQHFRQTGKLVSLSEQNLVDCSSTYGNMGCNGGLMDNAFQYIRDNGGIDTEEGYPYDAADEDCKFKENLVGAEDVGFTDIPQGNEHALKAALATVGPVSVAIDASQGSFQFYSTGVYFDPECSSEQLDHGVLAVGYGTDAESGEDYFLVKNSWDTVWGDQGYIKMARNRNNACGIASSASYPLV